MDKHTKTKFNTGNMQALRRHKQSLSPEYTAMVRHMLSIGVSKKKICQLFDITYNDLKTLK